MADRGLLYPDVEFVSRLWAIYLFIKESLMQISGSTLMLNGLEEFLVAKNSELLCVKCHNLGKITRAWLELFKKKSKTNFVQQEKIAQNREPKKDYTDSDSDSD